MTVLAILETSVKRLLRDRLALFFMLAFPVLIILIVGSATAGFVGHGLPIGYVAQSTGSLTTDLVHALAHNDDIGLHRYDDATALGKDVRRGVVSAGVVIPADYDARLRAGQAVDVQLLVDQTGGSGSLASARTIVTTAVGKQAADLQAASFAHAHSDKTFDDGLVIAKQSENLLRTTNVVVSHHAVGKKTSDLDPGIGYQTASNLLVFVFITSLAGSQALIESRRLGITRRMLGAPLRVRTILAGEMLSRFALAAFQALFIYAVGRFVFGKNFGSTIGAFSVIVLFVLVGTTVGILFGTLFSRPEQASALGPPLGIGMAMLGGCMWPLEIVPKTMQTVGHIFPHAWAMDAWITLIGRGQGISHIGTDLLVLAGYVVVLFPIAAWRLRRAITAG